MSEIDNALQALAAGMKQYVTTGCEGPSGVTFTNNDHVFLVVLSKDAGLTPLEAAKKLDAASNGKHVFAVVVGDQATGYSTLLSPGKAEELFQKSMDISNSPQVAMGVYTSLVQRYEATAAGQKDLAKLQVTTTQQNTAPPAGSSVSPVAAGGAVLSVVLVAVAFVTFLKRGFALKVAETPASDREYNRQDLLDWVKATTVKELPPQAAALLTEIKTDVLSIAIHWDKVKGTDVGREVQDICFNLIPKNLELYRSLPLNMRNRKVKSMGVVPNDLIVQSLTAIEEGLDRVRDAAFEGSVRDLTVEATFAKLKYDRSALEL